MTSESSQQMTEISADGNEQILSLLQVQGEEGSGHETIQLVTTTGDGEGIEGQETLLLQPAIEVNGERHVILQQAQDPNTGEVLVFLQGENGETLCLPPEALNANIVQMGDGGGQVYTLALPSDGDGSSVVVVSEHDGIEGATVTSNLADEPGTTEISGRVENITTTGESLNISLQSSMGSNEQLIVSMADSASSSDLTATHIVQSIDGPLMATTTSSLNDEKSNLSENTGSNVDGNAVEEKAINADNDENGGDKVNEIGSVVMVEEKEKEGEGGGEGEGEGEEEKENSKSDNGENNMNYGSAVIQVQDANSTTTLESLVTNAMIAAGDNSSYVIMATNEDGELPKEINLADVINAGSASGQTIFLQTSEGLVACQAATTGEDGTLQIVADSSGNTIAVSSSDCVIGGTTMTGTSESDNQLVQSISDGQTLAYTLSSTSSGIELTPVSNVVSASSSQMKNQLTTTVSASASSSSLATTLSASRSRFARSTKPRTIPTAATTTSTTPATMGETLLLPSKNLVTTPSVSIQSSSISSGLLNSNNNASRRRTITNRGRSNVSISITPSSSSSLSSSSLSSFSTTSSTPIIPVQPDAIHTSSSDFSSLNKSSISSSAIIIDGSNTANSLKPSQLAASRRTYSKKNNIVWLNPETTNITKRNNIDNTNNNDGKNENETSSLSSDVTAKSTKNIDASKNLNLCPIDLPAESNHDSQLVPQVSISTTTTTTNNTSTTATITMSASDSSVSSTSITLSSKLTVKPPSSLTVSSPLNIPNVPALRSNRKVTEPIIKTSSIKTTTPILAMGSKDYSRVSVNLDKSETTSSAVSSVSAASSTISSSSSVPGLSSMMKVSAVPQFGRVVTAPVKITSPLKPNSPPKVTSPTKVISPIKIGSPSKTQQKQQLNQETNDADLDFTSVLGYDNNLTPASPTKVSSPVKSPDKQNVPQTDNHEDGILIEENNRDNGDDVSRVKKQANSVIIDSGDSKLTPRSPEKSASKNNHQELQKIENYESTTASTTSDSPNTRSRKRKSESVEPTTTITATLDKNEQILGDDVLTKTSLNAEVVTPFKKRVNFALIDNLGDNDATLPLHQTSKQVLSTTEATIIKSPEGKDQLQPEEPRKSIDKPESMDEPQTEASTSDIPNTRSRKRKSESETLPDHSHDHVTSEDNVITVFASESSTPPKKRANLVFAQTMDSELIGTPTTSWTKLIQEKTDSQLKDTPKKATNEINSNSETSKATMETPSNSTETRSTRSKRRRSDIVSHPESNDQSTTGEGSSITKTLSSASSTESVTPSKKKVNFAPGTTVELITDDDDGDIDGDGDDDDSESALLVDEKKKEKRTSGRKRTSINKPVESPKSSTKQLAQASQMQKKSPSQAQRNPLPQTPSQSTPHSILKMSKRVKDSGPLLLHFGTDDETGDNIDESNMLTELSESRGPSEYFDFTINESCFHIRHQPGRLTAFSPTESNGNYACLNNCGYRTSRINNIILHNNDHCTVVKMQWQSEIQHMINRQRLLNHEEAQSSSSTSGAATSRAVPSSLSTNITLLNSPPSSPSSPSSPAPPSPSLPSPSPLSPSRHEPAETEEMTETSEEKNETGVIISTEACELEKSGEPKETSEASDVIEITEAGGDSEKKGTPMEIPSMLVDSLEESPPEPIAVLEKEAEAIRSAE